MSRLRILVFRFFIISSLVILLLGIIAFTLSRVYEDDVKAFVISKIDQKFSAKIDVEEIELSFWRKFPHVSLRFRNIMVTDNHLPENPPVLAAKNLFLQFNFNDIIREKFILRKVEVTDGKIDLLIYQTEKNNYDLFQDSSESNNDFFLSAESFVLKNMIVSYENQASSQFIEIDAKKVELPFSLNKSGISTGIEGAFTLNVIRSEGVDILKNLNCDTKSEISYNYNKSLLKIEPSVLNINSLPFNMSGTFDLSDENIFADFHLKAESVPLLDLIEYLPQTDKINFNNDQQAGLLSTNLMIKGNLGGKKLPLIQGDFSIKNASLSFLENEFNISNLSLKGDFSSGKKGSVESVSIQILQLGGNLNGKPFSGDFALKNLKNPLIKTNLIVGFDLKEIQEKLKISFFQQLEGQVSTAFQFMGTFDDLKSIEALKASNIKGSFELKNGKIQIAGQNIIHSELQTLGEFTSNNLIFSSLKGISDGKPINASANITNYLDLFIENSSSSLNVDASIVTTQISFEKLMEMISLEPSETESNLKWIARIDFRTDLFVWDKIQLQNIKGQFQYFDEEWSITGAKFNFNEGDFVGQLHSKPGPNNSSIYSVNGNYNNLNISKTFAVFENFDQDIVTSKNISGKLSGRIEMIFAFNSKGDFEPNSLTSKADFTIENGQLNDVDQLKALSKYTRIDDFSNIMFSTLSNTLTIENQQIIFPMMHIESNKMSLDMYGTHNFDNVYDYHLNVLLSEVLGRKVQKTAENEFGIVEDDGTGKTRMYLRIFGKGDNFEVKYDKKEASNKVKNDLKDEGQEIKNTLRNEFVNSERDSLRRAKRVAKEIEIDKIKRQENGEIFILWDDTDEDEE
jgi:hypothetical protein